MSPRIIQLLAKPKSSVIGIASRFMLSAKDVVIQHDIQYAEHRACKLDVYTNSSIHSNTLKPAIVVIHGGGWIAGDKRERAVFCAALAKEGYVIFNVNYRLAPQFPLSTAINDCSSALKWVRVNASKDSIDPQNISVIGDSAGAHLASLAALKHPTGIKKLILYYGIFNLETAQQIDRPFMRTYIRMLAGDSITSSIATASPISHIHNFPPTLLIASEKDPLHTQTSELAEAMQKANIPHATVMLSKQNYPYAVHGFQSLPNSRAGKISFNAVLDFLRGTTAH